MRTMRKFLAAVLLAALVGVLGTPAMAAQEHSAGSGASRTMIMPDPIRTTKNYFKREAQYWGAVAGAATTAFVGKYSDTKGPTAAKVDAGLKAAYVVVLGGVVGKSAQALMENQ